jgi:thiosulfate reductase/polysulfide reductase chain A
VQGLAKRLGVGQYFDYTIDQWNEAAVKELPIEMPFEYLKKHGVYTPPGGPKYGATLNAEHRFVTKSGKIELYCERLQEMGQDPLPVYQPPAEPPAGKFRLVLGRKAFYTHANSTSNPWLFDFAPENRLWMNPAAAVSSGIGDGDWVEVASSVGSARLRAKITQEIRPDCVFMLHGFGKRSAWLKRAYNRGGSDAAILETAWDKASGNAAMHETFVRVRKIGGNGHA